MSAESLDVPSGTSVGDPADLGTGALICPPSSEISLCLPEVGDFAAFCLCSRQAFGTATAVTVGDLDGDGLENALVRGPEGVIPYGLSAELGVLVAMSAIDFPTPDLPQTSYLPTLGLAAYWNIEIMQDTRMLSYGTLDLPSGASEQQSVALAADGHSEFGFGDFDGDGSLDLVMAARTSIGARTSSLTVGVYLNALSGEPSLVEVASEEVDSAIDTASLSLFVSDVDGDHRDDVWIYAVADGYPRVLWGAPSGGLTTPGTHAPGGETVRFFDVDGDGKQDLVSQGAGFGEFRLFLQPTPRSFESGPHAPADLTVEILGNAVYPVRAGNRVFAVGLAVDAVVAQVRDSAVGMTIIEGTEDLPPMRTEVLEGQTAHIVAVIDIDGDGHQELFIRYSDGAGEPSLYLFDVVGG